MSFEWFVALRYLTARRKQAFISLISGVSIVGVGVGVMALIIALALMTGVQRELRDRIVGSTAHVYVYKRSNDGFADIDAEISRIAGPGIDGVAPAIVGLALMKSNKDLTAPVMLKGIDITAEPRVTDINAAMRSGSLGDLNRPADARPGVVLGRDLAADLGVTVGDTVTVFTPEGTLSPFGNVPRSRVLQVVGIFEFGFFEFDNQYAFILLETAERLLNKTSPDLIQLRLRDMDQAPVVKTALQDRLGPGYQVQDWTELNRPLYSALWLEKVAISMTIGLIVMVAALNIVASLILLVMEKSRDIAILRTMGAQARAIRRVFIYQGLTIGLIGTTAGTILGLLASYLLDHYQVIKLSSEVYQITYLPFRVLPRDIVIVIVSAVLVCLAATIYPARQAGRLDPAEALRNQ